VKQHILSQTYQAGFVDPNTPPKQDAYVWCYSRERRSWKKRAPRNLSWETDLYTVKNSAGERNDSREKLFSVHEGRFAAAMKTDLRKSPWTPMLSALI